MFGIVKVDVRILSEYFYLWSGCNGQDAKIITQPETN